MAYYLREIATKCQACLRKPATHELLNSFNAPCGKFCERCDGNGVREGFGDSDAIGEYEPPENPCKACGGSGKNSVAGARLLPRGSSLVVR